MSRFNSISISIILIFAFALSLVGCGAASTPSASPTLSGTELTSPLPSATTSENAGRAGFYEPLSAEQENDLETRSTEAIVNFFENGYDINNPAIISVSGNGMDIYRGLGLLDINNGNFTGELAQYQVCLLGGEVKNGHGVMFLGCENRDKEKILIITRMGQSGANYFTSNGENYFDFVSNIRFGDHDICTDSVGFYNFIVEKIGNPMVVEIPMGPIGMSYEDWAAASHPINDVVKSRMKDLYYFCCSGLDAAATMFKDIHVIDESSTSLNNYQPENTNVQNMVILINRESFTSSDINSLIDSVRVDQLPFIDMIGEYKQD